MNPDACRDVMDRSKIPYDGGTDTGKITSGLDELSLRKQLPLRQQATRPTFKYNMSMTKSVHLFHQGDYGSPGTDVPNVGSYNSSGMYYTGHINSLHKPPGEASLNLTRVPNLPAGRHTGNPQSMRNNSNPYVRPVSATEVAANINGEKAKKMIQSTVDAISDNSFPEARRQTLQRNSFLRPLSGVSQNGKEKVIERKQNDPSPSIIRENSSGSDSSVKQYSESKSVMKSKFQFASTASSGNPASVLSKTTPTSTNATMLSKTTKQPTSNLMSTSTARNPSYSPNKTDVNNASMTYDPTRPDSVSQYTNHTSKVIDHVKSVLDDNRSIQQYKPIDESYNFNHNAPPMRSNKPQNDSNSLKKMPVTNTLTGAVYYRKASISGTLPKSPSAPAFNTQGTAKASDPNYGDQTKLKSAETGLSNPQAARRASNPTPWSRPTLERSNASLQIQTKPPLSENKKGEVLPSSVSQLSSSKAKNSQQSVTRPNQRYEPSPKTSSNISSKKLPRSSASSKSSVSNVSFERRSVGDGAPGKGGQFAERKKDGPGKVSTWDESSDLYDESDDLFDNDNDDTLEDDDGENTPTGERLPGDGEASDEDYDDDDDDEDNDEMDNFEEELSGDDSDDYSVNSKSTDQQSQKSERGRPSTAHSITGNQDLEEKAKGLTRPLTASGTVVIKPPFRHSLFKKIPPTLNFVSEGEKPEQLPWEFRKLLKWKMSPITPIVVRRAIARVGFRISKKNHDWLGCFGKHMKSVCFKSLREYQKLNHFPGSFQIGRKDRLWRNLSRMQVHFGKKEFNFFPHTYVLPTDMKQLKRAWEDGNTKQKWIIKPPASARGIGIKVISKWSQIPRRKPLIVQRYLSRPYLINGSKFDMRVYVYISSYDPLRIYVYEDGLARFASCKYSSSMKSLSNRYMHLTNYSINKKNSEYLNNGDNTVCQGHKWSLKSLWIYMKRQGINTTLIWDNIRDLIIKTIICGDGPINSMTKSNARSRYCCHELFGFDILLDENLKPWILEVNISPSLHSNSQLDITIKGGMIKDLMNIAGIRLPDERDVTTSHTTGEMSSHHPPNKYCMDKRLFTNQLAPDERAKHAYYVQKHQDEAKFLENMALKYGERVVSESNPNTLRRHKQIMQSILDVITPDDMRHLCDSIDEDSRKGNFQRLFPTPHTHRYLRFFEQPRYYNLLLDQWVLRYNHMEQRGILLLQSFCEEGIHLENPTTNSKHQWAPPNSSLSSFRAHEVRPLGIHNTARGRWKRLLMQFTRLAGLAKDVEKDPIQTWAEPFPFQQQQLPLFHNITITDKLSITSWPHFLTDQVTSCPSAPFTRPCNKSKLSHSTFSKKQ